LVVKKLVSMGALALVLACLAAISPAAGETYNLTLTPAPSPLAGAGQLDWESSGTADDFLRYLLSVALGIDTSNFPSGDYKFSAFWFFQPNPAMTPLVAGNSYQLSWDWNGIKFGYPLMEPPLTGTFDYSAVHSGVAQEQTASGANYMVVVSTNAANTLGVAGIFGQDYNVFAFMTAEVPSNIDLDPFIPYWESQGYYGQGGAPILTSGQYGSNAFGALETNPVPLPGSLLLLGSGLLGLGAGAWRRRKALSSQ
jgi:hypothetical protein